MDELLNVLGRRRVNSEDLPAIITSLSPLEVDLGGEIVPARNGIPNWPLRVDDVVRVTRYSLSLIITSNTAVLPTAAVVTVATGGSSTVTVQDAAGLDYEVQIVGTAPTVGTDVVLYWTADGGYCLGKRGVTASPPPPPAPPPPPPRPSTGDTTPSRPPSRIVKGTAVLWAQQVGNARGGDWRTDSSRFHLLQGHKSGGVTDNNTGYWFYGSQVDKIRGATVTGCQIWLRRLRSVGDPAPTTVHLKLHASRRKPSNPPSTHGSYNSIALTYSQSGWFNVTVPFAQEIADRTSAGLAIAYSGTADYLGLWGIDGSTSTDPRSGALRVTFQRSS